MISAADAPKAIALLKSDPTLTATDPRTGRGVFQDVYIHYAQTNMLGVSVKALLTQAPPKIAIMDIGGDAVNVLIGYLKDAGLYNSTAFGVYPTIGDVFTQFQQVTDFTGGGLSKFSILWMPHWSGSTVGTTSANAVLSSIATFNNAGNSVFAECAAADTMEAFANGHFMTTGSGSTLSLLENKLPNPWPDGTAGQAYVANPDNVPLLWSNSLVQIGDYPMPEQARTGALFDFTPATGKAYKTSVYRLVSSTAPSNEASYQNRDLEVVLPTTGSSTAGPVIYLGGHAYGTDTSSCGTTACDGDTNTAGCQKDYGSASVCIGNCCVYPQVNIVGTERLVFNTLIFLGQVPQSNELTRSSPIVYSDGKTYLGTYVQQSQPTVGFPPWAGHFREYPSGSLAGTNVTSFATPGVDWDSSLNVAIQASNDKRTIFTAVQSSGAWVQTGFTTANAGTLGIASATITAIRTGGLGGIDHSIPAIIGPSTVAGSPTRPTVAYVGALDGMLHGILVSDPSNLAKGFSPGDELWAFIPPSQLSKVVAQTSGVDGNPSVGDAFITVGSAKVWKTLLAIPDGNYGGTLDTIDITDPLNPAFLWEGTDTVTASGKTYVMGRAQGAAISPVTTTPGLRFMPIS